MTGVLMSEVKQSVHFLCQRRETQEMPLRVNRELTIDIIRTKRYARRDELSLILEAREYIKGRLPVRDRATAVAILLQRDRSAK